MANNDDDGHSIREALNAAADVVDLERRARLISHLITDFENKLREGFAERALRNTRDGVSIFRDVVSVLVMLAAAWLFLTILYDSYINARYDIFVTVLSSSGVSGILGFFGGKIGERR